MNPGTQPESAGIRLLVVDDHPVVRTGLVALLSHHPDLRVAGEAGTVREAIDLAVRLRPDVVLMDVRLPDGRGYDACRRIRQLAGETRVLFLTSFADEEVVRESLDAGADGYLLKEIDEAALVRGIREVAAGRSVLDPAVMRRVLGRPRPGEPVTARDRWESLSPQERRVLALVAEGKTNKEIAVVLGLSDKTVKNYFSNLLEKLGINRRSQAAAFYVQIAATNPEPPPPQTAGQP
jgi:two-component system, NarL family, response regulator DevR